MVAGGGRGIILCLIPPGARSLLILARAGLLKWRCVEPSAEMSAGGRTELGWFRFKNKIKAQLKFTHGPWNKNDKLQPRG